MNRTARCLNRLIPAVCLLLAGIPAVAHAHTGAGATHGFLHGMAHPMQGLDHLCAMFAVGVWAAQMGGRALWRVPTAFVCVMALGGVLGMSGAPLPHMEGGIVVSLLVLGVFIAAAVRLPQALSAAIVGVFAVFHGYAHGAEMPPDASGLALLHASGIVVARLAQHYGRAQWLRVFGAIIALCGAGMALAG